MRVKWKKHAPLTFIQVIETKLGVGFVLFKGVTYMCGERARCDSLEKDARQRCRRHALLCRLQYQLCFSNQQKKVATRERSNRGSERRHVSTLRREWGLLTSTELCFYNIIIFIYLAKILYLFFFGTNFVLIFKFIRQCWCGIDRSNHILLLFYHVMILF